MSVEFFRHGPFPPLAAYARYIQACAILRSIRTVFHSVLSQVFPNAGGIDSPAS